MNCIKLLASLCCLLTWSSVLGQTSNPPLDSVFNGNVSGVTIDQITDFWGTHLDPADTGEGGGSHKLQEFKSFWSRRVSYNDSSGHNMFAKYFKGLEVKPL